MKPSILRVVEESHHKTARGSSQIRALMPALHGGTPMNRITALIAAIALGAVGTAYALHTVSMKGEWPRELAEG
jgi:hypothetical protein